MNHEEKPSLILVADPGELQQVFNRKQRFTTISAKVGDEWKRVGYISWAKTGKSIIIKVFQD